MSLVGQFNSEPQRHVHSTSGVRGEAEAMAGKADLAALNSGLPGFAAGIARPGVGTDRGG